MLEDMNANPVLVQEITEKELLGQNSQKVEFSFVLHVNVRKHAGEVIFSVGRVSKTVKAIGISIKRLLFDARDHLHFVFQIGLSMASMRLAKDTAIWKDG